MATAQACASTSDPFVPHRKLSYLSALASFTENTGSHSMLIPGRVYRFAQRADGVRDLSAGDDAGNNVNC